jgi:putative ABC transport system permease protein
VDSDGIARDATGELVSASSVGVDYFDAFGAEIVAGRGFNSADLRSNTQVVVVNEYFVTEILQGRNAVGRRIRYTTRYAERSATGQPQGGPRAFKRERGQWYEIVGVVKNLGMDTTRDAFTSGKGPGVYHPLTLDAMGSGGSYVVRMAFHVRGDAASFAPQLRAVAQAVHPALRLYDVLPLDGPVDRVSQGQRRVGRFFAVITALVALIALLISIAGTYSVLSFTVSRQTREIGIRIALGADPRRIVAGVFSRAMVQIGVGIIVAP